MQPSTHHLSAVARQWRNAPMAMFEQFVRSPDYRCGNRSTGRMPASQASGDMSVVVYLYIFRRFVQGQEMRGKTVLSTTPACIRAFRRAIDSLKQPTRLKYLRLVERTYDHLVALGVVANSPVRRAGGANLLAGEASAEERPQEEQLSIGQLEQLHLWLLTTAMSKLHERQWRGVRDCVMASMTLATGMTTQELVALERCDVAFPDSPESAEAVQVTPRAAERWRPSVPRVLAVTGRSLQLLKLWWTLRWSGWGDQVVAASNAEAVIYGELVFPATNFGTRMSLAMPFRALKRLAQQAVREGALTPSTAWVLARGPRACRRAAAFVNLMSGADSEALRAKLGFWHPRSVRRYRTGGGAEPEPGPKRGA